MTQKELAQDYERNETLDAAYDKAEAMGDSEAMENARAEYELFLEEIKSKGEAYGRMSRLYNDMRKRGNEYIDFSEPYLNEKELVETMKEYGFEKFTFSSTWTGAVESAWKFQANGCTLEGMTEINGTGQNFRTGDYEKVHAFLFRID